MDFSMENQRFAEGSELLKQPWDTVEPIKQLTPMITKMMHIHS